jgi:hypothetical protein
MRRLRHPEMARSTEHRAAARAKDHDCFIRWHRFGARMRIQTCTVLSKTEIVTMRPGWPGRGWFISP